VKAGVTAPLAPHERWFVPDDSYPVDWSRLATPEAAVPVALAVAAVSLAVLLWRMRGKRPLIPGPLALGATPERLAVLMGWVPLLLAVHTAVPLLVSGVDGLLFTPNLSMGLPAEAFVGLAEIGVGLLLFYGALARYAALGLAALWTLGLFMFGPVLMLEQAVFLGLAAFFYIAGRGPIAVDRVFGVWAGARERLLPYAVPALRVAVGFGFAWLAFTEKLLNLPLALAFLEAYPAVNFTAGLGVPLSDETFVRAAGTVELTAGLLVISGAFPRAVILFLWLPFNLTLALFGWRELVGHLPIYATMALLLLWGAGGEANLEALRAGLIPVGEKPVGPTARRTD
jgi:hypothetical protein